VSVFNKDTRRVLSYDVLYGSRKRSYDQGGCVRGLPPSPAYNVEPVTNTSSSSCENNEQRTTDAAMSARRARLDAVRRGFIFAVPCYA